MPIRVSIAALCLLAACASQPKLQRIDDSLLVGIRPERMGPVLAMREARDTSYDALAYAKRQVVAAQDAVALARADLEIAGATVDRAIVALDAAEHSGTAETLAAAAGILESHESAEIAADLAVVLSKRSLDVAKLRLVVAEAEARLADARVEAAKATALEGTELPAAQSVSKIELDAQVRDLELELQKAKSRLAEGQVKEQKARNAYETARAAAPK